MKKSYGEGLATHTDPESCVIARAELERDLPEAVFSLRLYLIRCDTRYPSAVVVPTDARRQNRITGGEIHVAEET